ncbi:hypothetical protein DXG01_007585 [Tephrocybe rancida]|nr:hypothetical protein DXG01_007585 [Tephrocybe rancida]
MITSSYCGTVGASPNANQNGQKWTFWRVHSDGSYVIRNYTSGRFLGLLYHGKLVGVDEGAAIHWDVQPSGYDGSTWVIRLKNDTLDRVLTLTGANGDVILDHADFRRSGLQEWRLRDTEYHWPVEEQFLIEEEVEL